MAQLVSDFIITPVLRQARRLSTGFANNNDGPANEGPTLQHRRTRSIGGSGATGSAILEQEGHARLPTWGTLLELSDVAVTPATTSAQEAPAPAASSSPNLGSPRIALDDHNMAGPSSGVSSEPSQQSSAPPTDAATDATTGTSWPLLDATRTSPLPEDDGMGDLRRRIQAIQLMDVAESTKAQMLHRLLTEKYTRAQQSSRPAHASLRPVSPASSSTLDPPEPVEHIGPLQAFRKWNPLGDGSGPLKLPLTGEDLRPTYAPNRPPADEGEWHSLEKEEPEEDEERRLGCEHYRRNVKLQCASCERWYTCRLCHDAVEDHVLPRQQTKHMLCMLCGCAQKASDTCIKCGQSAAYYYCSICKLWNDDPNKPIYHCPDCGLCRVGQGLGKDFFHCKKCMTCISISSLDKHKCIERSTDCDCPICNEYMFNSPKSVIVMQCGHSIHRLCFEEHMKTSYKCPLCNKSCINMEYQFRNFDIAILNQPMPPEYADARAVISCNDCSAKSQTAYHWLGLKCAVCRSYNTTQLQLLNMPSGGSEQRQQLSPQQQQQEQEQQRAPQPQLPQQQPVALDPAFLAEELRRQTRAARRAQERQQRERDRDGEAERGFALLSTSPSSYSPAFLFRLLYRTALSEPQLAGSPSAPSAPSTTPDMHVPAPADADAPAVCDSEQEEEEDGDEADEEDDMLDLFGAWDRDFDRLTGLTSAESAVGFDDDDEDDEEEEEDGDEEEDESEDEREDEEEDEEDILLVGHR
ncbi:hypothetical protein C8A03DRAFT_45799 [Achaetomium macrosporum]|uniref:Zf-CHY-domain-containing protein n=1 Tax=Achaetomium macrosporum TaxID=79813 RepID=A0AAN7C858_9PEZI|nr:hypothetical protein C8A03DRAFT_45799 [Achaetomium macrosporum]